MEIIKRFFAYAVLAMLIAGMLPLAFADDDNDNDDTEVDASADASAETSTSSNSGSSSGSSNARIAGTVGVKATIREDRQDRLEDMRNKLADREEKIAERLDKLDEKTQDRLLKLRADYTLRLSALENRSFERIAKLDEKYLEKFAKLSRDRQEKLSKLTDARIKAELDGVKFREVRGADDLKLRIITKARLEAARADFDDAKERFEKAREEYKDARERYNNATTEEERLAHAKEVLSGAADSIITHLEKIKSKVQENENLNESEAADLTARIDAHIQTVTDIKAKIDAATTKEEIKAIAKELRQAWADMRFRMELMAERVITARVQGVLNQGEVLQKRLDTALAAMAEQNISVDVDAEVDEFNADIAAAKDFQAQAKAKLKAAIDADTSDEAKDLVEQAHDLIKKSQDSLKDAHDALRQIIRKIREAGHELEVDTSSSVEIEIEAEDSAEAST